MDDVSAAVSEEKLPVELSSVTDKLIRYDVRFEAVNPKLSNEMLTFFLHIDIEVQNDYKPGYPIIKRGIYYAARDICSQLGVLTEETNYDVLRKAYSIWICNDKVPAAGYTAGDAAGYVASCKPRYNHHQNCG